MNTRAIQWMFRMPSCFGAGMRASRIGFIGFLVAFILSGPFAAEAQQAPPVPADSGAQSLIASSAVATTEWSGSDAQEALQALSERVAAYRDGMQEW